MKRVLFTFSMLILSSLAMAKPELKGSPDELRQFLHPRDNIVSLHAEAKEKAYADKAIISLVVTTEKKLLATSLEKNSQLREKINQQLLDSGIDQQHIRTSKFSTSPQYGWFGKTPDSFKVVNRMVVSVFDEKQLKVIAALADSNNEVRFSDTRFEHTEKKQFEKLMKNKALADIMEQKAYYEKNLGLTLTAVNFRDTPITFRAAMPERIRAQNDNMVQTKQMSSAGYSAPATPSSFDEIEYQANITVDFKIGQ